MIQSETYSLKEAREILGISIATMQRHVKTGRLPTIRVGHRVLIPKEYVDGLFSEAAAEAERRKNAEPAVLLASHLPAMLREMETQRAELVELRRTLEKPSPLQHPNAKPSFTVEEACSYLRIGRTALNDLMASGQIAYHQPEKRGKITFTQRQLDTWREKHEVAPTKPL